MTSVGFLGLGIMGSRMAANLQRKGFAVTAWTRTAGKAQAWADEHEGARAAATPAEAAADADIVITMVVDGAQVEALLLGPDGAGAAARGGRDGVLFVDMSTIAPADARRIGAALAEQGHAFVDAPVTGSSPKAQDGTLTFMVGATDEQFRAIGPALEAMGELIVHAGPLGQGQMVKLINNATAAANAATLAQALIVGKRAGVDLEALVTVMGSGAGGSTMLDLKAGPMREHDYSTLFKLEHMLKDVRLCLEEGQRLGVPFPSAAFARELLSAGMGMGHADADFAAILEPLEGLAGTRL
jgi:3-hydroxyisobutyrate dehydrogenase